MFLSEVKQAILKDLRHEPLDQFQIAADLAAAPWLIRAELKGLKRNRLVHVAQSKRNGILWQLTDHGRRVLNEHDQLELGETS
jgi:predicted transcriptional regulator